MRKISLLTLVLTGVAGALVTRAAPPPNIVIILAYETH
jgi:hypothetical protein